MHPDNDVIYVCVKKPCFFQLLVINLIDGNYVVLLLNAHLLTVTDYGRAAITVVNYTPKFITY